MITVEEKIQEDYLSILERSISLEIRKELEVEIPSWAYSLINKRVHLKSLEGIYKVIAVVPNGLVITCNKWLNNNSLLNDRLVKFDDFKCIAGGKFN